MTPATIFEFRLIFLLQFGIYANSLFTDPPVLTNGGTVDLSAVENATNVSVFCAVTFNSDASNTVWRLGPDSMSTEIIGFGQPAFSNFVLENPSTGRTNLIILSFSRDNLDMMVLECTNGFGGALENAFFIPRFIG